MHFSCNSTTLSCHLCTTLSYIIRKIVACMLSWFGQSCTDYLSNNKRLKDSFIHMSVRPSVCLSVCLCVRLYVCVRVFVFVCLSVRPSVCVLFSYSFNTYYYTFVKKPSVSILILTYV